MPLKTDLHNVVRTIFVSLSDRDEIYEITVINITKKIFKNDIVKY